MYLCHSVGKFSDITRPIVVFHDLESLEPARHPPQEPEEFCETRVAWTSSAAEAPPGSRQTVIEVVAERPAGPPQITLVSNTTNVDAGPIGSTQRG